MDNIDFTSFVSRLDDATLVAASAAAKAAVDAVVVGQVTDSRLALLDLACALQGAAESRGLRPE